MIAGEHKLTVIKFSGMILTLFLAGMGFCDRKFVMTEKEQKKPVFNLPKVISLDGENAKETIKMTAEEQLKKSLLAGTLKTNIRLAPESRITKDNPGNQSLSNS